MLVCNRRPNYKKSTMAAMLVTWTFNHTSIFILHAAQIL